MPEYFSLGTPSEKRKKPLKEEKKLRKSKPEKIPMLGYAWVTLGNGRCHKAVIQRISLEAKAEEEVGIRMSGFLLHDPGKRFEDAEVVGRFTPLGGLWKALEKLFAERENRSLLDRAENMRIVHAAMARQGAGATFAYLA